MTIDGRYLEGNENLPKSIGADEGALHAALVRLMCDNGGTPWLAKFACGALS